MIDSRCARAAYNNGGCGKPRENGKNGMRWKRKKEKIGLVRRISIIADEIVAHPPDFTEFLILIDIDISCKRLKR
jgi:hypothetical protein